jgi:hypothetical protein
MSQICPVSEKSNNDPDNPKNSYFGIITYRLRSDVAYIFNNGKISKVKEISQQDETQKSVDDSKKAAALCDARKKELSELYSVCK